MRTCENCGHQLNKHRGRVDYGSEVFSEPYCSVDGCDCEEFKRGDER